MKRLAPGYYEDTVTRKADNAEVRLTVTRVERCDGMTETNWYFQIDGGSAEDWFPTKAAAEAAGRKFAEKCYLDPVYGWVIPVSFPVVPEPAAPFNATAADLEGVTATAQGFFFYTERPYTPGMFSHTDGGTLSALVFIKKPSKMGIWDTWDNLTGRFTKRGVGIMLRELLGETEVYCSNGFSVKKGARFEHTIAAQCKNYPQTRVFYGEYDVLTGVLSPLSVGNRI